MLLKRMLDAMGFKEALQSWQLPQPGSNQGYRAEQLIEQMIVSIWCGAARFAHADITRLDNTLVRLFGWGTPYAVRPCGVALLAQGVQVARLSCGHDVQLCVQHGQHGQQFAAAKLSAAATLKAGKRFGCDPGERSHVSLLEAKRFTALGDRFTEFRHQHIFQRRIELRHQRKVIRARQAGGAGSLVGECEF